MVTQARNKVSITLPPLHKGRDGSGGQQAILADPARFKVIVCGRRWGKTTFGVVQALKTALEGGRVWWLAPTYKLATEGWLVLKPIAQQLPTMLGAEVREADRMVRIEGTGGSVEIRSTENENANRGAGLDGAVFDEFAQMRESLWFEEVRAALADRKGWATFIGTPRGKNWAYRLAATARIADDWQFWQKPTIDNPYIDPDEIDQIRQQTPDAKFKQEYEADFGASQMLVYPDFNRELHQWKWAAPRFDFFVGGLDFGGTTIGSHLSAGTLGGYVTNIDTVIQLAEFEGAGANVTENQIEWMGTTEARIAAVMRQINARNTPVFWRADKSQSKFIDIMRQAGFRISPSRGGPGSVNAGIDLINARLQFRPETGNKPKFYYLPGLEHLPGALERYRYPDFKEAEDKPQSPNPLKVNDDTVDALRYEIELIDLLVLGEPDELYGNLLGAIA